MKANMRSTRVLTRATFKKSMINNFIISAVLISLFLATAILPVVRTSMIGMDRMQQMGRLTNAVNFTFELD